MPYYWLANLDLIVVTCRQYKHGQFLPHTSFLLSTQLSPPGCRTCRSRETCASCFSTFRWSSTLMSGAGSDQRSRARRRPDRREPRSRGSSSWPGRWAGAPGCSGSASGSLPHLAPRPLSLCKAHRVVAPGKFLKSFHFFSHLLSPSSRY